MPLAELFEFSSGLSKSASEFGFGNPFVTFKDVFYNFRLPEELTQLVNTTEPDLRKCSVQRGDVFLTRTSETLDELGMSSVALKDYPMATFNGFTKRLRPKPETQLYPEYLAYVFRSSSFRRSVTAMSSMSTRASLNNDMLARLTIPVPDLSTQIRIGNCLASLDDKIELNRRTNQTLEELAQVIFQARFVASASTTLNAHWAEGNIADLALNRREQVDSDDLDPGTPYTGLEHMPRHSISLWNSGISDGLLSAKLRFKKDDLLFGKLRPYFHKVGIAVEDGICSTDILVLRPKTSNLRAFCVCLCASDEFVAHASAGMEGTKMPRTSWDLLQKHRFSIPGAQTLTAFQSQVGPLLGRITSNVLENRTLATLRNELLKRLFAES